MPSNVVLMSELSLMTKGVKRTRNDLTPQSSQESVNPYSSGVSVSKSALSSEKILKKRMSGSGLKKEDDYVSEVTPVVSGVDSLDDNDADDLFDDEFDDDDLLTESFEATLSQLSEEPNGFHHPVVSEEDGPASSQDSKSTLDDSFYGLPLKAHTLFKRYRKIDKLHDWQEKLMKKLLDTEDNMIYCVPTGGGKTLVAEIMLMRQVLLEKRDAILVLPFISIVQEKMRSLLRFAEDLGFALEEYAGGKGPYPVKKRKELRSIFVCTMEKAHVVVTSLLESNRISDIGLVVFDELHMIGESGVRGTTLETLIIKLKLAAKKYSDKRMRMLGMSATLNNLDELAQFFDGKVYRDDRRPVELKQYIMLSHTLTLTDVTRLGKQGQEWNDLPQKFLDHDGKDLPIDPDNIRSLVGSFIPHKSVLVFCPTKKQCESVAGMLSRILNSNLRKFKTDQKRILSLKMSDVNNGFIPPVMRLGIPMGIAYHHSGLTPDERRLIEEGFRSQVISCICCTSTLAAGVNLPAERVIIRAPYIGINFLTKAEYQQICGRAGRPGLSTYGESILMYQENEKERVKELLEQPVANCKSGLSSIEYVLSTFILNLLELKLVSSIKEIKEVITDMSLCGLQQNHDELHQQIDACIDHLFNLKLLSRIIDGGDLLNNNNEVTPVTSQDQIQVSRVGKGVVKSFIDINRTLEVYESLKMAQRNLSLDNYLHLIFMVTLLFDESELLSDNDVKSEVLLNAFMDLEEGEIKAAEVMGIPQGLIMKYCKRGAESCSIPIRRFFVSLIIYEVWKKRTDLLRVADKFGIERGRVFSLMSTASTTANKLYRFVDEMKDEFWAYSRLMPDVCEALTYCCSPELIPLMKLPGMRVIRAKQLYNAGFTDILSIARLKRPKDLLSKMPEKTINMGQARTLIRDAMHLMKQKKDELQEQVNEIDILDDDLMSISNVSVSDFGL